MSEVFSILAILATGIKILGGAWLAWGMVQTGLHIRDRDGGGIREGILQIIGAGIVLAGGVYLGTLK